MGQGSPQVGSMFGRIAGVYDFLNHTLSLGIDKSWRKKLARIASPPKNGLTIDLAAGTLDVAMALMHQNPEAQIAALDFCPPMLEKGLVKIKKASLEREILPCCADAFNLPVADETASRLTIAFGIRNITPRVEAFREMVRVLAPGGMACVLEFGSGQEWIMGGIYNIYLNALLPLIGRIIARDKSAYSYLARTIREFPPAPELAREMEDAGFVNTGWRKLTFGIVCLHWGYKPQA